MNSINKEILEVLDDELRELKEEIAKKKQEIKDKEEEIEENEDFEADDDIIDDMLNSCYEEVDVIGDKYEMSEVLKALDECKYEAIRDEETENMKNEKRDELESDLEELEEELEELEEQYGEAFEDNDE